MQDFFRFLERFHKLIFFLFLETIALFWVIRSNGEKNAAVLSSANAVSGYLHESTNSVTEYFHLKSLNEQLVAENLRLRKALAAYKANSQYTSKVAENWGCFYKSAHVIKNSVYDFYNILTIDKGRKDGIAKDMAVLSDEGIVGIVANVSHSYATVVSLLNTKIGVSAQVQRTGYFGEIQWDGKDYRYVTLHNIPSHSLLYKGDKISTSGYSSIFPPDIPIGTVESFEKETDNSFYVIRVKLAQDFKRLHVVYVVDTQNKEERKTLEAATLEQFN